MYLTIGSLLLVPYLLENSFLIIPLGPFIAICSTIVEVLPWQGSELEMNKEQWHKEESDHQMRFPQETAPKAQVIFYLHSKNKHTFLTPSINKHVFPTFRPKKILNHN